MAIIHKHPWCGIELKGLHITLDKTPNQNLDESSHVVAEEKQINVSQLCNKST